MAKKDIYHTKKSCGGLYDIEYTDDNIPYLKCTECEHTVKDWIKWDQQYSKFWEDESRWENKADHLTCVLGYFCHRYKDHYDMDFTLSLNEKGLFRGPEINILRRIYKALGNNPKAIKSYIDWYFLHKIQRRKKRILSLSFLAVPALINEYKLVCKKNRTITRDKKLPKGMHQWLEQYAPGVKEQVSLVDYGDLKLLLAHYKNGVGEIEGLDKFVGQCQQQGVVTNTLEISRWVES